MDAFTAALVDALIDEHRDQLSATFREKYEKMEPVTRLFTGLLTTLDERGHRTHGTIVRACLGVQQFSYEISIHLETLALERHPGKRNQIARHLAMVTVESMRTFLNQTGKPLRMSLRTLRLEDRYRNQLQELRAPIVALDAQYGPDLRAIRNMASAHFDIDSLATQTAIDSIDSHDIMEASLQVGQAFNDAGSILTTIFTSAANVPPPEQH